MKTRVSFPLILGVLTFAGWVSLDGRSGTVLADHEAAALTGGADCVNAKQKVCGGTEECEWVTVAADKDADGSQWVKHHADTVCGYPHVQPKSCGTYNACNPCSDPH
jgi:hypothetical protein